MNRQELARIAVRSAFEARKKVDSPLEDPICAVDLAEKLGVKVWFVGGGSFAGVYAKGQNRIFVPSERPPGRRAYTCAHELAHWWFKHGTRVEELDFDRSDNDIPEEILANTFASSLLMPRRAVNRAFVLRGLNPSYAEPTDIYAVACQLGVGYETLLMQMRWSLDLVGSARLQDLQAVPPKEIRLGLLGQATPAHLILADVHWSKVAIDMEVGDFAIVPRGIVVSGGSIQKEGECASGCVVRAVKPGLSQLITKEGNWAAMSRVCRKQFTGMGAFRHLEESEDEDD